VVNDQIVTTIRQVAYPNANPSQKPMFSHFPLCNTKARTFSPSPFLIGNGSVELNMRAHVARKKPPKFPITSIIHTIQK